MPDTVHMEDLLHTTCEDMIRKAENDYQYLKKHYDKVFVGGLSTGAAFSFILPQNTRKLPEIFPYHHRSDFVTEHL